jgi:hypothetical protein
MEGQLSAGDFTSLGLSQRPMAMNLGDSYDDTTRNAHKRSWPFATDDRPYSFGRPSSPSVCQPAEPLYLLGSVSRVGPLYAYLEMLTSPRLTM